MGFKLSEYCSLVGDIYTRIQKKIFYKIYKGKESNFKDVSKEKLLNIFHSDVWDAAGFADSVCSRFRYLLSTILTIGYVFLINIPIAFGVIGIVIINYFVLNFLNRKISEANRVVKEKIDLEFEGFSEVVDAKDMLEEYAMTDKVSKSFEKRVNGFLNSKHEYYKRLAWKDNDFATFYHTMILIGTLFMMYLLRNDVVSLTVYLVVVSYLKDSVTNSKDFMGILTELKNAYVSSNRINLILDFSEQEAYAFGDNQKDTVLGSLDFVHVDFNASSYKDYELNNLKDVSFHVEPLHTVLFQGPRNCGKRSIFYLLRRRVLPSNGKIFMDQIPIVEYKEKFYKQCINYLTTKPYFFHDTVLANLKLVDANTKNIKDALKTVGLLASLEEGKGLKTLAQDLSNKDQYLLGLARLLLTKSEILILYEFPNYLSQKDEALILHILKHLHKKKTILIFSANDNVKSICDTVFEIKRGSLKKRK